MKLGDLIYLEGSGFNYIFEWTGNTEMDMMSNLPFLDINRKKWDKNLFAYEKKRFHRLATKEEAKWYQECKLADKYVEKYLVPKIPKGSIWVRLKGMGSSSTLPQHFKGGFIENIEDSEDLIDYGKGRVYPTEVRPATSIEIEAYKLGAKCVDEVTSTMIESNITYKFQIGDKVKVCKSGRGVENSNIGDIVTIVELGPDYGTALGYKVDPPIGNCSPNSASSYTSIGEESFELYKKKGDFEWDLSSHSDPLGIIGKTFINKDCRKERKIISYNPGRDWYETEGGNVWSTSYIKQCIERGDWTEKVIIGKGILGQMEDAGIPLVIGTAGQLSNSGNPWKSWADSCGVTKIEDNPYDKIPPISKEEYFNIANPFIKSDTRMKSEEYWKKKAALVKGCGEIYFDTEPICNTKIKKIEIPDRRFKK